MNSFDARKEVTGIVLFFCSLALTLIYVLSESIIGPIGIFIKNLGFWFIGAAAYMIPVFLCYAAFDFFIEKREGVSPIRVRSVIFLMICVAAVLAVSSTDYVYFKSLCMDDISGKFKATTAISLLLKSGPDASIISNGTKVIPGGLIGGMIACALNFTIGKILSILTLIVVLLSQVILVFHISLKKTAKTAVKYINNTKNTVVNSVRAASGNNYGRYNSGTTISRPASYNPSHSPRPYNGAADTPFVNIPKESNPNPNAVLPMRDPFSRESLPVDRVTGFTDVSAREFGVQNASDPNSLNYENRTVSTVGAADAPKADFSFDALAKNPRLRNKAKEVERPSFLPVDNKSDFYNLDDGVYASDSNNYSHDFGTTIDVAPNQYERSNEYVDDDLPQEIIDDEPYATEPPVESSVSERYVNTYESAPVMSPVTNSTINSEVVDSNSTTYDPLEGRTVETNEANHAASTDFSNSQSPSKSANKIKRITRYSPPPLNLLAPETAPKINKNDSSVRAKGEQLVETLRSFGIDTEVVNTTFGPAITRYELKFKNSGVKVSKVLSLENDIALSMAAISVRIEAPIPGTSLIGIEIPNEKTSAVQLSGLIRTQEFKNAKPLEVPLGKNISGKPIMCDLAKMPHLLIAGSTGSGKSVCINTILASILYHSSPNDVRMILVDPKVVELSIYNGIPHLLMPVVTDPKKAISALKWAALEMDRRYKLFAESNVRNLDGYNDYLKYKGEQPLPLILIVVDELADLMTLAKNEVEEQISRLAAMARAAGLHLILATQRPSVDVISGVIKANVPSRIAFAVSSGTDSRTILDSNGAEKLLGKGDMLYAPNSAPKAVRGQGAFLSDKEVDSIVQDLRKRYGDMYDDAIIKIVESQAVNNTGGTGMGVSEASAGAGAEDELLDMAVDIVIEAKNASVSILQRRLGIGYPRAARLIDVLEQKHVIGPFEGSKPRKVLITKTDWLEMKSKG